MKHPALLRSVLLTTLAACASRTATPAAAPATAPAPAPVAAPVTADAAVAAPPADPRREAVLAAWSASVPNSAAPTILSGPIAYPEEGAAGARVAAVVVANSSAQLVVTAVPFVAGQQALAMLSLEGDAADAVTGLAAQDVNGDHHTDVAVFLRREPAVEGYLPLQRFARIFSLTTTPERQMSPMDRAEVELLGVRDAEGLTAALPTLGHYEAPRDGMSPARFLARLRYATPAEFRQAVAPTGLRLCTDVPDRSGTRRKRCVNHPVARLTDALITGRIRRDLGQFVDILVDDARDLTFPSCRREGQEIQCNANRGGPDGVNWSVVGEGAAMRIAEISPWAESS
ncbi:MAG: hypothetical protein U0325_03250 [Polyangiales bacterium]